jgi:methionine-rich copper-binding protein CopC
MLENPMRRFALLALAPLATALCLPSTAALAHTRLVSSAPAANASQSNVTRMTLTFSADIVGALSGVELTMTAMPGMANHDPMPITGFTTRANGRVLTVTMPRALPRGTYLMEWHVVAADQHRMEGNYTFTVR